MPSPTPNGNGGVEYRQVRSKNRSVAMTAQSLVNTGHRRSNKAFCCYSFPLTTLLKQWPLEASVTLEGAVVGRDTGVGGTGLEAQVKAVKDAGCTVVFQ